LSQGDCKLQQQLQLPLSETVVEFVATTSAETVAVISIIYELYFAKMAAEYNIQYTGYKIQNIKVIQTKNPS